MNIKDEIRLHIEKDVPYTFTKDALLFGVPNISKRLLGSINGPFYLPSFTNKLIAVNDHVDGSRRVVMVSILERTYW